MSTLKVGFLLVALTALFVWVGNLLGGTGGMILALGLAVVMNVGSYWFSDKIVLKITRAKLLDRSQAPQLYDMVERLAQRAGIPMPRLALVPDPSPNAFATGRNPENAVVAVNQGLLDILDSPEVEGVLAHELSHVKHRDTLTMAIVATLAGAIMVLANILRFAAIFGGGDEDRNPLVLMGVALIAPLAALVVQMAVSRSREYEADRGAAEIVGTGRGLASALVALEKGSAAIPSRMPPSAAHMCIVNPLKALGMLSNLFSTHPPISERIRRLEALEPRLHAR